MTSGKGHDVALPGPEDRALAVVRRLKAPRSRLDMAAAIAAEIDAAVEAEREACAKLCDHVVEYGTGHCGEVTAQILAKKIRGRS